MQCKEPVQGCVWWYTSLQISLEEQQIYKCDSLLRSPRIWRCFRELSIKITNSLFLLCFTQIVSLYQLFRWRTKLSVHIKSLSLSVTSQPMINVIICPLIVAIKHLSRVNDWDIIALSSVKVPLLCLCAFPLRYPKIFPDRYYPLVRKVKSKHAVTDSLEVFLHFFHVLLVAQVAAPGSGAWARGQCSQRCVFQTSERCFTELIPVVCTTFSTFLQHCFCFL